MDLTHSLEQILYLLSSSLYLPVILIVTLLAAYSIYAAGRLLQEWLERRKLGSRCLADFKSELIVSMAEQKISKTPIDIVLESLLQSHENRQLIKLDQIRFVIKLGPALGLMGTLIPMGISLAALAQGNIPSMASSMVTAFTATVTGLGCSVVAYLIALVREQWLRADFAAMRLQAELTANRLLDHHGDEKIEEDGHALSETL
ncbi:MotA/TolQ/ExbB proton channel family protein [Methylomonas sp. UP202]|uniref:MotA/TolQ/ExbB proton channel family protein n=1 Tax=Methylomonas sp. UP202 TaxID=3040943 RepID=UPI002479C432|nr:MotA/TolQ/ExbB proton channel family protein [Methylomonas sp. UP202]WGS85087.1 MotA/TolQ/ExbB proton channel family protein [Methylomonas sp. UP202]